MKRRLKYLFVNSNIADDTFLGHFIGDIIPGRKQSFSSYPGSVTSGDDFYMLSSGMVSKKKNIHVIQKLSVTLLLTVHALEKAWFSSLEV